MTRFTFSRYTPNAEGAVYDVLANGCATGFRPSPDKAAAAAYLERAIAEAPGRVEVTYWDGDAGEERDTADELGLFDVAPLGEQTEAHMADAILHDRRGLASDERIIAAWEPSMAGRVGVPFGWRIVASGDLHRLERTDAMPPRWQETRTLSASEAHGLVAQLLAKGEDAEVAISLDTIAIVRHGSDMASATDTKETSMAINQQESPSHLDRASRPRKLFAGPTPDGTYISRTTANGYAYAVAIRSTNEKSYVRGEYVPNPNLGQYVSLSWHGTRALAVAKSAKWQGSVVVPVIDGKPPTEDSASIEATGATESRESTKEEQDMAKSADKTTSSRSRAASTKTKTRSSGKSGAKNATAAMQTVADKVDTKQLHDELLKKIKSSVRGVTAKASPKGSYTTIKVGVKPVAYLNPRAKAVVIHLGLTEKPEDVKLDMQPYSGNGPRFALQTKVTTTEQIEEALKAIEAAAVLVAK